MPGRCERAWSACSGNHTQVLHGLKNLLDRLMDDISCAPLLIYRLSGLREGNDIAVFCDGADALAGIVEDRESADEQCPIKGQLFLIRQRSIDVEAVLNDPRG